VTFLAPLSIRIPAPHIRNLKISLNLRKFCINPLWIRTFVLILKMISYVSFNQIIFISVGLDRYSVLLYRSLFFCTDCGALPYRYGSLSVWVHFYLDQWFPVSISVLLCRTIYIGRCTRISIAFYRCRALLYRLWCSPILVGALNVYCTLTTEFYKECISFDSFSRAMYARSIATVQW
jgi:hypothetical protein